MTEVVVIGGGVIGSSIALELARLGSSPVLLEAASIGAGVSGSSLAAISRHLVGPVDELPFVIEATAGWEALATELRELAHIDIELDVCGQVRLLERSDPGEEPSDLARVGELVAAERAAGLEVTMIDPDEASRIIPILDTTTIVGGSWCPGDAKLNALAACHGLAAAAVQLGADVRLGHPVRRIEPGPPWRVHGGWGSVEADAVIVAAGPWTPALVAGFCPEAAAALEPRRAQCCATERLGPTIGPIVASISVGIASGYTQLHQTRSGEILFNTVVESASPRLSEGDLARHVDPAFLRTSSATLLRLFPSLASTRFLRSWAACEAWTPDQRFILGPVGEVDGLLVAAGDSGTGFLRAPLIGRLLAELALGNASDVDLSPYRAERFTDRQAA